MDEGPLRFRYAKAPVGEKAEPEVGDAETHSERQTSRVEVEPQLEEIAEPEPAPEPIRLPWRGAGNVVAAAGCAILALVGAA